MFGVIFIITAIMLSGCDQFLEPEVEGPPPLKIEKVLRCNKYKTCVVVFSNGSRGLMTSPKAGEYGCKSITQYSFIRCNGP